MTGYLPHCRTKLSGVAAARAVRKERYGSGDGYGRWKSLADFALNGRAITADPNVFLAFWRSSRDGGPANGGSMQETAQPGLIQRIPGPLRLCGPGALHATLNPDQWKGDRLWIVALRGGVAFDGDKVGALEREIICEVPLP